MNSITRRFVLLIATAAVAPLIIYGLVSFTSLRDGTEESVSNGNFAVAQQIAARIRIYFENNVRVLRSIGTEVMGNQLQPWQQTRVFRNYVLDFPEFREISLFQGTRVVASSRIGGTVLSVPKDVPSDRDFYVAPQYVDNDLLPTTTIALRLTQSGSEPPWIVAELSLEELWRTVDQIKVGGTGYALLMDQQNKLIAHGNPNDKNLIVAGAKASDEEQALAAQVRQNHTAIAYRQLPDPRGEKVLATAATISNPEWTVIVEQPVSEAFGIATRLER